MLQRVDTGDAPATKRKRVAAASKAALRKRMGGLKHFSAGLLVLGELAPERMTIPQSAFFLIAALADLNGKAATFSDIRDTVGPLVNRSLHTTYKVLLDENRNRDGKRDPGLGWLTRETDPQDMRRKYLKLTATGRRVIEEVLEALNYEEKLQ